MAGGGADRLEVEVGEGGGMSCGGEGPLHGMRGDIKRYL